MVLVALMKLLLLAAALLTGCAADAETDPPKPKQEAPSNAPPEWQDYCEEWCELSNYNCQPVTDTCLETCRGEAFDFCDGYADGQCSANCFAYQMTCWASDNLCQSPTECETSIRRLQDCKAGLASGG